MMDRDKRCGELLAEARANVREERMLRVAATRTTEELGRDLAEALERIVELEDEVDALLNPPPPPLVENPPDWVIGQTVGKARKYCVANGIPQKAAVTVATAGASMQGAKGTFLEVHLEDGLRGVESWRTTRNVGLAKNQLSFWKEEVR